MTLAHDPTASPKTTTHPLPLRRKLGPRLAPLRGAARWVLDLVLPPLCLGCEGRIADHDSLCPECWRKIDFIRAPLCDRTGLPLPYGGDGPMLSAAAAADPPIYDRARAVALFDGLMRDLVHDLKFRDAHDGRRLFGRWLVEAGRDLIAEADAIVPMPLARLRLLGRRLTKPKFSPMTSAGKRGSR